MIVIAAGRVFSLSVLNWKCKDLATLYWFSQSEKKWLLVCGIKKMQIVILRNAAAAVVSDSVRPHRGQPTRLPRPWDSPGKNTGVGCHFLLRCMKVKSESEVAQSCPTLSDPMDCSLPGSSTPGISQARVLEWSATVFSDFKE